MSVEDAWHARPQLFFKCLLRPRNGKTTPEREAAMTLLAPFKLRSSSCRPRGPWIMPP